MRSTDRKPASWMLLLLLALWGCSDGQAPGPSRECDRRSTLAAEEIVECLYGAALLGADDAAVALDELSAARRIADSLHGTGVYDDLLRARFVLRSLQHLADLYDEGARDSARLHRWLDHVAVSADFVRGNLAQEPDGYWTTGRTPHIAWVHLPNVGIFADPVGTVTRILGPGPASLQAPLDALEDAGEAVWRYGVPMSAVSTAPVWELHYPAIACTIFLLPPRRSAAAQTAALRLFTELARRTGAPQWVARAEALLPSFEASWAEGGVRVPGRTGAWWEEADPRVGYWRSAAAAAIAVADLAALTSGERALQLAADGILAARTLAPSFDDGLWTRDCLAGGYQDRDNHALYIRLARALHERTGDDFWLDLALRWEGFSPPPGFVMGDPRS
ncbi:MAG TPA: D-glucuronyl C5-epimerase family protein [Gemmatimonadales bacterium]